MRIRNIFARLTVLCVVSGCAIEPTRFKLAYINPESNAYVTEVWRKDGELIYGCPKGTKIKITDIESVYNRQISVNVPIGRHSISVSPPWPNTGSASFSNVSFEANRIYLVKCDKDNTFSLGTGLIGKTEGMSALFETDVIHGDINGYAEERRLLDGPRLGFTYAGYMKEGFYHDQGTMSFANGNKYIGEFLDDKYHGQGTYTWKDGDKHVGEFRDGNRDGPGVYTCSTGKAYSGTWVKDEFQGGSTPCPSNMFLRVGKKCVAGDCDNGCGTMTWTANYEYVGSFKNGKSTGSGRMKTPYKEAYDGEWLNDKFSGKGTFIYASGDKYVGEYRDGNENGQGTYTGKDGNKYVGEFRDGKKNGQGTMFFANGEKYVGEFRDGKKSGQGTETFMGGSKYVGEFRDNERNGQGVFTCPSGKAYSGTWVKDKFQGGDITCP